MPIGLRIDTTQNQMWGASPRGVSRDPTEVVPNLFLGSCSVGNNKSRLQEHDIQAVVDASMGLHRPDSDISYLKVNVEDLPDADLLSHLQSCCSFIQENLQARRAVLVHCQAGISRSAAIVIAFLFYSGLKQSLKEAYDHVVSRKPNVHPNEGFFRQLQVFEQQLSGGVSMNMLDYYRHSFIKMGYPRQQVDQVMETAGTDDYNRLVSILHSRGSRPSSAVSALSSCRSSMDC